MGKYRGSKSPTVRLQTGRPEATRARISEAMRRISEPMRPAAMVETRDLGSGPASRASATRSRQVSWISMGVTMPGSDPAFQGSGGTMPPDLHFPRCPGEGRGGQGCDPVRPRWPVRPALRSLTPWPPLHFVERGNLSSGACEITDLSYVGPP